MTNLLSYANTVLWCGRCKILRYLAAPFKLRSEFKKQRRMYSVGKRTVQFRNRSLVTRILSAVFGFVMYSKNYRNFAWADVCKNCILYSMNYLQRYMKNHVFIVIHSISHVFRVRFNFSVNNWYFIRCRIINGFNYENFVCSLTWRRFMIKVIKENADHDILSL